MNETVTTHWRFRHAGRTLGPYPWPLIVLLHSRGSLSEATPVQRVDDGVWMPLRQAFTAQMQPLQPPAQPTAVSPAPLAATPPLRDQPAPVTASPATPSEVDQISRFHFHFLLFYVIPLLALAVRRGERVALAMESRAFGALPRRTYYRATSFGRADVVFFSGALLALVGAWISAGLVRA